MVIFLSFNEPQDEPRLKFHAANASPGLAVVRGCSVQALRPREHFNTKFFAGQYIGEAPEKGAIHANGYEIVDNIPTPGQNGQPDLHADSFREEIRERPIALHLSENILFGDEADQEGLFGPGSGPGFFSDTVSVRSQPAGSMRIRRKQNGMTSLFIDPPRYPNKKRTLCKEGFTSPRVPGTHHRLLRSLAERLVKELGMSLADVARLLGGQREERLERAAPAWRNP